MAISYLGTFGGSNGIASKTAGTSLGPLNDSWTAAVGDDIFLSFYSDDGGSAHSVTHVGTASITWTLEKEQINTGNVKSQLWRGNVTGAGTVTSITISWTTDVTAKGMIAGRYSGVGTSKGTDSSTGSVEQLYCVIGSNVNWAADDLIVGAGGRERPGSDNLTITSDGDIGSVAEVGQNGTTGAGAASNIVGHLIHGFGTGPGTSGFDWFASFNTNTGDGAVVGAVYAPAAGGQTHQLEADLAMTMQVDSVMRQVFRWAADLALTAQVDSVLSQTHQIAADLGLTAGIDTSLSRITYLESDLALLAVIDSDLNRIATFASDLGLAAQVDSNMRQAHRIATDLALLAQIDSLLRQKHFVAADLGLTAGIDALLTRIAQLASGVGLALQVDSDLRRIVRMAMDLPLTGQIDTSLTQINKFATDLGLTAQVDSTLRQVHRVAADLALTAQIDSLLRQINKIALELGLTGQIDTALTQINKLVTDLVLTAQIDSVLSQTLGAVSSTGIVVYAGGLGAESNGSTYGAGTLGGALNTASYPP